MSIDEWIALLSVQRIYGYKVFSFVLSPWFLIPYSLLVFSIEYLIISGVYLLLVKAIKSIKRS